MRSAQPSVDVFDDDDRSVHHQADSDGDAAERHQVGGHAENVHENEGEGDGERDRQSDDDARPDSAHEGQDNDRHQPDALHQGVGNGRDALRHQFRLIVIGDDAHAGWERLIDLCETDFHVVNHLRRVRADQFENQSGDRLPLPVKSCQALAHGATDLHLGHVANAYGNAIADLENDVLQVL